MEKYQEWGFLSPKIRRIMKLTLAFTLLCIIHISANTYAQTTQVSVDVKNGTFYDVVKQVEKQSEYLFFYNSKDIPNDLPFSLQKTKSNITVILDYLVEKYDLSYKIDDRQIFLTKNAVIQQQQGKRITGIVKEPNGEPIIGANVMEKGTTNGTITDVDGKFSLEVFSDNATVIISYIGYLSNAVSIKGQSVFNITLKEDSQSLEEVVVVGYGTQKKATLTGAVSNIGNEELIKTRSENVKNMISGKIPGVRVVQKSGEPGSYNTDMQIRGMGAPLVIIDGVPRSNMDRLDPNEIESFSVLKDASAAIYGVKAANGVVIITTKRGKTPKLTLDYNGSVGWQQASNIPETLNAAQWMELTNENAINQGRSLMFTQEDIDQYRMGLKPETKWSDVGFDKIAPQTQHSISAQGKSDKIDYFMNFGYMKQDGFYSSGDLNYERYNVRTNINGQITKNLKVEMQLNGMMGTKNEPIMDAWEVYKAAWMHIPTLPVYANNNPAYLQQLPGAYHPIALTTADISGARKNHQKLFQSTFTLDYAVPFIKGLNVGAMYSYDYDSSDNRYSRKEYALYEYDAVADSYQPFKAYSPSRINRSYYKDEKTLLQLKLNYERTFKEIHNLKVLFLYEETTHKTDNFAAQRDLPMDAVDEIFAGATDNQQATMNTDPKVFFDMANKAFVGRINYDFKSKYLAEFSFRYDGSSKFAKGSQWGFFPSFLGAWRISEEDFFKNCEALSFINNLKVRGTYGVLGDDNASTYQFLSGYTYPSGGYLFNNSFISGLGFRGMANSNITWFEAHTADLGLDVDMWNGLLSFQGDIFRRYRKNLLATRSLSVPGTLGAALPQENLNSDLIRGFEIGLSHTNSIGDFRYTISGNISYFRAMNKYIERAESNNSYRNWRDNYNDRYGDFYWGYEFVDYFHNMGDIWSAPVQDNKGNSILRPGDYQYIDWNEDGIIDGNDERPIDLKGDPRINFGFTLAGSYKGFDVNLLFQGAAKGTVINQVQMERPLTWDRGGLSMFMDRWHTAEMGTDTKDPNTEWIPGYYPSTNNGGETTNYWTSSRSIQNVNYLRLKSAEIGYTFPQTWMQKVGIQNLRLYFNAYNLFTLTGLKYIDPEHPSDSYSCLYPITKTYNVGMNITF